MHYVTRYDKRHPKIKDAGESKLINSFIPINSNILGRANIKQPDFEIVYFYCC